jgi:hypothetical protein
MFHVEHLLSTTSGFPEHANKRLELLFNALFDVSSATLDTNDRGRSPSEPLDAL